MNLDVRRQDLAVQFLGFCLNSFENVLRLLPTQHENDALNGVIVLLKAKFAQARRVPDGHISHITYSDRYAFVGADDDVPNVLCVPHQSDAANVVELSALRIEAATGIRVVGRQSGSDLWNGQVISVDARGVEQYLILHHRSAKARVVRHSVDRTIRPLNHPVFNRFQFLRTAVRTFQNVAIDQATRAEQRGEARSYAGRQGCLSESLENNLPRKIIVGVVLEGQDQIGQPI